MIALDYEVKARGKLSLKRFDRETGALLGEGEKSNTIVNLPFLVDLIQGVGTFHMGPATDLQIRNSSGTIQKTIPSVSQGPLPASGGSTTYIWADNSTDSYPADDCRVRSAGSNVAIIDPTGFGTKPSGQNWEYAWTFSIQGQGFQTAGLNRMVDCIANNSADHLDGTELSNNMRIRVFDLDSGGNEVALQSCTEPATQPTSTSIRYRFEVGPGARDWERVELENGGGGAVDVYHDTSISYNQGSSETVTYQITLTFT